MQGAGLGTGHMPGCRPVGVLENSYARGAVFSDPGSQVGGRLSAGTNNPAACSLKEGMFCIVRCRQVSYWYHCLIFKSELSIF